MSAADKLTLLLFGAALLVAVGTVVLSTAWAGVSVPLFFM